MAERMIVAQKQQKEASRKSMGGESVGEEVNAEMEAVEEPKVALDKCEEEAKELVGHFKQR